jgi:hypothetical protein
MNEKNMPNEPDLDRPGQPHVGSHGDGSTFEIEQTVRDNCAELASLAGEVEDVTQEMCVTVGIDWRDWSYYVVEMIQHDRWTDEHMLAYETHHEATYGVPAPGMAELRARMRKDRLGLTHLDPDHVDDD